MRLPFASLPGATAGFSAANHLGRGATADVYRGELDGADIAVKRLALAGAGASTEARADLERRFLVEVNALAAFSQPRIVRLVGYAIDDAAHPFAIAFELLELGCLANHLRGPNGEARKRADAPPLSAQDRIEIALGAASGLSFLHGHVDEEDATRRPQGRLLQPEPERRPRE